MSQMSVNPATMETLATYDPFDEDRIERRLAKANEAFLSWRETSFDERALLMKKAAEHLLDNTERYAKIITDEMGKISKEAKAEIEKSAWVCNFYAEHAETILDKRMIDTDAKESFVRYDPLGAVLAVMPWNFPFWQVFRFAAPSLMAGNVGLLKHASNVPAASIAIEEIFKASGFPEGVFQSLLVGSKQVSGVIEDDRVAAVTLTGSEPAGRAVAKIAGGVLKKCVLELGGSDPFIVLEDADIEKAAKTAAFSRMLNAGQSCIAAKRFIVVKEILSEFTDAFQAELDKSVMGEPTREDVTYGPLARKDLREELHAQVEKTLSEGATLALGGKIPDWPGCYYPATLLTGVTPEMTAATQETFGPVAAVIEAKDETEAIAIANRSAYGLGGAIWTKDLERGKKAAARVESGALFVNGFTKSDPRLPFGGVKNSGYGRELSDEGIREFTNIKTVWVSD